MRLSRDQIINLIAHEAGKTTALVHRVNAGFEEDEAFVKAVYEHAQELIALAGEMLTTPVVIPCRHVYGDEPILLRGFWYDMCASCGDMKRGAAWVSPNHSPSEMDTQTEH